MQTILKKHYVRTKLTSTSIATINNNALIMQLP